MMELDRNSIKQSFRTYFESCGYTYKNPAPILPRNDPSVLFTNATITPYKPNLSGELLALPEDIILIQNCLRVGSDTEAGSDPNIFTMFEMLGVIAQHRSLDCVTANTINYITDYYFSSDQLLYTVHKDDKSSYDALVHNGIDVNRIKKIRGNHDIWSYWNFGIPGIGGYGATMVVDRGEDKGCLQPTCDAECPCGRHVQLLNIINIDKYHHQDGSTTQLVNPGIDVGCGLERLLSLKNDVTGYECDPFDKLISETSNSLHLVYGQKESDDQKIRIIADYTRSIVHLISEGVLPGNKQQNYIVRKMIRRVFTISTSYGASDHFVSSFAKKIISIEGLNLSELQAQTIIINIEQEEIKTVKLLEKAREKLSKLAGRYNLGEQKSRNEFIDKMWSTYGIPKEITLSMI